MSTKTRTPASGAAGFYPDPGKDFTTGNEAEIAKRLDQLAKHLGVAIYGISGHRTPAQSVAVGGFANDPHTKADAADIGVNSQLRSSAGVLSESLLNQFGLTRPFGGAQEINHVQLLDGGAKPAPGGAGTKPDSSGGGIVKDAGNAASDVFGGAASAASELAKGPQQVAQDAVNWIAGQVEHVAVYAFLVLVLIGGGAALGFIGLRRAFSTQGAHA